MSSNVKVAITGTDNTKPAFDSAGKNISNLTKQAQSATRGLQSSTQGASSAIRALGGSLGSIQPNVTGFSNGLVTMTGALGIAAAGIGAVVVASVKLAEQANQYNRVYASFEGLATGISESAESMLGSLRSASRGMISDYDLVLSANRAMVLGVADNTEEMSQLMEVAIARGNAMGLTATQAFNDIVTGLGRMSPMILDNLGIVTGGEKVFEDYADAIGKATDELTDAERKQALINLTISSSTQIVEDAKNAQVNATAVLRTSWTNFATTLGQVVAPAYNAVAMAAANALKHTTAILSGSFLPEAELQSLQASLDAIDMSIAQLERVKEDLGQVEFNALGDYGGGSPAEQLQKLYDERARIQATFEQQQQTVMEQSGANITATAMTVAESTNNAISAAYQNLIKQQSAAVQTLTDEYNMRFQRLQEDLTTKVGYTGAARITEALQDELQENIRLWQMFGYSQERIAGETLAWFARQADAAKTLTGSLSDVKEVSAALGTTVGQLLTPMIGDLTIKTALLGDALGDNIQAGASIATEAMLGFGNMAGSVLDRVRAGIFGVIADVNGMAAQQEAMLGRRNRRDSTLPSEADRGRINNLPRISAPPIMVEGPYGKSGILESSMGRLGSTMLDLDKAASSAASSVASLAPSLESLLASVPGLFSTSQVTAEDMLLGGNYQNKADEYLRRLRDEVQNGVDWEGVDIGDAAGALGLDGGVAAEEVLRQFEAAWQNSSLFANPENMKFLDMTAIQAHLEQQLASAEGEKNLKALFGIGSDKDVKAVAALGLEIQSGLSGWLTENGFDDAGASLASALGAGVKNASGGLGSGVAGGLNDWMSSKDGTADIDAFAERLSNALSDRIRIRPNMELPPADNGTGAGGWPTGTPRPDGQYPKPRNDGPTAQYVTLNINKNVDAERTAAVWLRRVRR